MSASKDNLHERLRRATRPLHDELERAVGIGEQIATRERYRVYLSRLWALHVAAETAIAAFDFSPLRFAYPEHYRSRLLADDLATVGVRAEQLRLLPLPQAPRLHCVAAALGAVYVVEGSAKGARAILPQIAASLGYDARQGACGTLVSPPSTASIRTRPKQTNRSKPRRRRSRCSGGGSRRTRRPIPSCRARPTSCCKL
jgi:heme oxygenase